MRDTLRLVRDILSGWGYSHEQELLDLMGSLCSRAWLTKKSHAAAHGFIFAVCRQLHNFEWSEIQCHEKTLAICIDLLRADAGQGWVGSCVLGWTAVW